MAETKRRITFEEAKLLYPDEWVVFSEPRMNLEITTFIDGVVYFHGKDHDEALEKSAEIDGDAAVDFTGTRHYERIIRHEDAQDSSTAEAA
ncbi:MAG: hypothetical protein HY815_26140 [Candidatus Riflebacteria bacterium]|nr:hypothetical protein [Candidatus Riflebacteria bacterium]